MKSRIVILFVGLLGLGIGFACGERYGERYGRERAFDWMGTILTSDPSRTVIPLR
jgi:hypothetical protein